MYIFVKHNFLKNYISINFFLSGKSVVLFTCVPPMDSLVTINVGKILQFIFHISGGGGGSYFSYILLNEIQTTFSLLAKKSAKGLASRFVYWSRALRQKPYINGLEKKQKHGGQRRDCFSLSYILVIRKFIDCLSLFRHGVWFSFSVKQFPSAEFGTRNT